MNTNTTLATDGSSFGTGDDLQERGLGVGELANVDVQPYVGGTMTANGTSEEETIVDLHRRGCHNPTSDINLDVITISEGHSSYES